MKRFKNILFAVLSVATAFALSCCVNENLPGTGGFDGPVSLTLRFNYKPLAEGLTTRGVNSDLDFEIRDLTVLFYDEAADEENGNPALVRRYMLNKDYITEEVKRDGSKTEPRTRQAYVTIDDIERNSKYRIYAAANIADLLTVDDLKTYSEQSLREYSIKWSTYKDGGSGHDPRSYSIPDAMFGYFSTVDQEDVIHHDTDLGVGSSDNRAEVIKFDNPKIEIHAWMKRVVSRLTIGFDGSGLNDGVEIYIKSVHVKDAVKACRLGDDNHAGGGTDVTDLFVKDDGTDARLNLVYTDVPGAEGPAITKSTPAFPRLSDSDRTKTAEGWNTDWYEYVHGNADILNPSYNDKSTTLYFMENVQGKVANYNGPKKYPKAYDPEYQSGVDYDKDGIRCGTYVEVEAYYKNATTQGPITYRFMLGQNTDDDFNVVRNCHYKLTLSFAGDANKTDWHIEFEPEEDGPHAWFPIPDDSQWEQSWVWHAYNEAGEPVAEICKELVYYNKDSELDWTKESSVASASVRSGLLYYQVVTVYPVQKDASPAHKDYQYTVDLNNGMVAQVLASSSKASMDDNDLKAGGIIKVLKRTQAEPSLNPTKPAAASKANYAIRRLTNGGQANYNYVEVWSDNFDKPVTEKINMTVSYDGVDYQELTDTETTYSEYNLQLGEQSKRTFRIKPYLIKDADNQTYPVVKIGGSYWAQKDLNTTHYFKINSDGTLSPGGPEIYPYKLPKETQTYKTYTSATNYTEETIEGIGDDGYDYDFGASKDNEGLVAYYERYPMYKDCGDVRTYNFFAASGTRGASNGTAESFKKGVQADYGDINPSHELAHFDPFMRQITQGSLDTLKYGYVDGPSYSYDTSNGGVYRNNFTIADISGKKYNHVLAPENWHALMTEANYALGYFGERLNDMEYLETFCNYLYYEHFMYDGTFNSWNWPRISVKNRNLSGLSLLPIPWDWETNDGNIYMSWDTWRNLPVQGGKLKSGVVFPHWTASIYEGKEERLLYVSPSAIAYDSWEGCILRWAWIDFFREVAQGVTRTYLPIRFVRNAYDYSVGTIEPETATNAQTKQER